MFKNNNNKMYELKNLTPELTIDVPNIMYALPNISAAPLLDGEAQPERAAKSQEQQLQASSHEHALLMHQQRILKRLEDLQQQLTALKIAAPAEQPAHKRSTTTSTKNDSLREEPLTDIVINGHPNFIPYALLALKHAWQGLFDINVQVYTHSTVSTLSEAARQFEAALLAQPSDAQASPRINVSFIWKDCEHTELVCLPTMYVPIYGEANIIRYFGRIGPTAYRYENSPLCNEIDAVLDICYQLLRCNTPAAAKQLLQALSRRLQKQKYFGGETLSVADIGVQSTLKRKPELTDKQLSQTLLEWRQRVQIVTKL